MKTIKGNILNAKEEYVAQQCNCLTVRSHGLSKSIIDKYGEDGDPYGSRKQLGNRNLAVESDRDVPGTIRVLDVDDHKHVICMFGQWCPGPPCEISKYKSYPNFKIDTQDNRVKWFKECLDEIKGLEVKEVAFPQQFL